ncbi:MAG: DUF1150 family protein [Ascidiaceihabitans sp.]|jgi:hypothetical protein|nr:DUF1150 family protein [Ascidiaceihabitans sp.]
MNTDFDFSSVTGGMVYVKPVEVADLPAEVREQIEGTEQLFSVHDPEGQQLALVADRRMAFDLARQHDYAPQAVH